MISIRYNNRNTFEDVNFSRNGNLVTTTPATPDTSGFTTWKLGGKHNQETLRPFIISPLSRAYIMRE